MLWVIALLSAGLSGLDLYDFLTATSHGAAIAMFILACAQAVVTGWLLVIASEG